MGFLKFGKKSPGSQPDPHLEDLTVEEAALLRSLFAEIWQASHGPITVHGDYAENAAGAQFGLYNLSRAVRLEPQRSWPQVVERHISGVMSRQSAPKDDELSDDEILALVKARLIPSSFLPESHREAFTYRRVILDGLEAILMLDHPEATTAVPDAIVSRFDPELLWSTAMAAVAGESLGELHSVGEEDGMFRIAATESMFTASRVLDMPALLAQAGVPSAPLGVLFAVPSRHHLAFHVVKGASAFSVVQHMHGFAQQAYGGGVGEISPNLFYWSEFGYEQITTIGEDGNVMIDGTGAFFDAINR
ncbi:hypothetical protein [Streptomyces sp. AC495_CC817]|uniref:hypothetical protein n=1 Tax=Streptomyces sp. AC495_CC817 TaxID=2823900 RepID=UPI001C27EBB2|nr:hypothetical protein [Streptomyces sp. AC495_CC817]